MTCLCFSDAMMEVGPTKQNVGKKESIGAAKMDEHITLWPQFGFILLHTAEDVLHPSGAVIEGARLGLLVMLTVKKLRVCE
jgi:hypothetical protein